MSEYKVKLPDALNDPTLGDRLCEFFLDKFDLATENFINDDDLAELAKRYNSDMPEYLAIVNLRFEDRLYQARINRNELNLHDLETGISVARYHLLDE